MRFSCHSSCSTLFFCVRFASIDIITIQLPSSLASISYELFACSWQKSMVLCLCVSVWPRLPQTPFALRRTLIENRRSLLIRIDSRHKIKWKKRKTGKNQTEKCMHKTDSVKVSHWKGLQRNFISFYSQFVYLNNVKRFRFRRKNANRKTKKWRTIWDRVGTVQCIETWRTTEFWMRNIRTLTNCTRLFFVALLRFVFGSLRYQNCFELRVRQIFCFPQLWPRRIKSV